MFHTCNTPCSPELVHEVHEGNHLPRAPGQLLIHRLQRRLATEHSDIFGGQWLMRGLSFPLYLCLGLVVSWLGSGFPFTLCENQGFLSPNQSKPSIECLIFMVSPKTRYHLRADLRANRKPGKLRLSKAVQIDSSPSPDWNKPIVGRVKPAFALSWSLGTTTLYTVRLESKAHE